jgi:Ca-activated chloride channel family protein
MTAAPAAGAAANAELPPKTSRFTQRFRWQLGVGGAVETSGLLAREEGRDELARAVDRLLDPLALRHRVGLVTFDDDVEVTVRLAPAAANAQSIHRAVAGLTPGRGSAVYDAIATAVDQAAPRSERPARTTAVVVLAAGGDDRSSRDLGRLLARLRGSGVRVFTIAYGSDADREALERIAATTQGKAFSAGPGELARVFREIALFF